MYIAKHHVACAGRVYTPGEVIDAKLTEAEAEKLLAKKAIATEEARVVYVPVYDGGDNDKAADGHEDEATMKLAENGQAEEVADCNEGVQPEEESAIDDDADEEFDTPEIDAMDGVVIPEKKRETKPGRKGK